MALRHHTPDSVAALVQRGAAGDCWPWIGCLHANGYGLVSYRGTRWWAHRLIWTLQVGPIPEGLTIDHLCRNTSCMNPDHMEVVTRAENARRGVVWRARRSECKWGHPFTAENTKILSNGTRKCRTCKRAIAARAYRKRKINNTKETAA